MVTEVSKVVLKVMVKLVEVGQVDKVTAAAVSVVKENSVKVGMKAMEEMEDLEMMAEDLEVEVNMEVKMVRVVIKEMEEEASKVWVIEGVEEKMEEVVDNKAVVMAEA